MASRVDRLGKVRSYERTPQGGIKAPAYLTRTGVFTYWTSDGAGGLKPWRELRLPEEVFAPASLASLAAAPVTRDHPKVPVTASNWKEFSIGHVGDHVTSDGQFVAADVRVQDAAAVALIEDGSLREFSCGYDCDVELRSGVHDGEAYDGIQRNIRYNHVGMGGEGWGRAGADVRLRVDGGMCFEARPHTSSMTFEELKALHDKLQGAFDAEKVRADAATSALASEKARADSASVALANERARADAAEKARTDAAVNSTPEAIEARVQARFAVVDSARSVLGASFKTDGISDHDLRVAVIAKFDPTFKADGRNVDYVSGRFDTVVGSAREASSGQSTLRVATTQVPGTPHVSKIDAAIAAQKAAAPAWQTTNVKR